MLEPGTAAGKRIETQVQDQKWSRTVQAMFLSEMQGRNITCRGLPCWTKVAVENKLKDYLKFLGCHADRGLLLFRSLDMCH